jgi:hypothetical protein
MPWTVEYNSDLNVIETVYTGTLRLGEIKEQVVECFALAKKKSSHWFLVDASHARLQLSVSDILDIPDLYVEADVRKPVIEAVVAPESDEGKRAVDLYEKTFLRRGWAVKVFSKRQEATDWLATFDGPVNRKAG